MERHIGVWHKENKGNDTGVGELLIEGNHIEFYSRHNGTLFPETFIGGDGQYSYKVFVNGRTRPRQNRILEYTSSHKVFYVLMQNFQFSKGTDISGIKSFSFSIPELINWIGLNTVFYTSTEDDEPAAGECHLESVCIKDKDPQIELYFESKTYESMSTMEDGSAITIKKVPRIRVNYEEASDIRNICEDIECLMQFFGLLIGKVSVADDIRLSVEGQELHSWLYINHDYSYNLMTQDIFDKPRTYYYVVAERLNSYYSKWRAFFQNDYYGLLRRIYFSANNRKEVFAEEVFVEYMRILDGYHTRAYGDAETERKLNEALKRATKEIKKRLFNDECRPIFEESIQAVIPDWKYNSDNMGEISRWIAAGYLSRKSLSHRLKELDKDFLEIIRNNALNIEKHSRSVHRLAGMTNEQIIELYFKELGDTRNYLSHYKHDTAGVLEFSQICESISTLKASIIAIFLIQMGMDKEMVRTILEFDSELSFQTMFLRKDGEEPFLHPKEWIKKMADEGTE